MSAKITASLPVWLLYFKFPKKFTAEVSRDVLLSASASQLWDFRHSHYIQFTRRVNSGYRNTSAFSDGRRRVSQMSYNIIMGQNPRDKGPIYTDFD